MSVCTCSRWLAFLCLAVSFLAPKSAGAISHSRLRGLDDADSDDFGRGRRVALFTQSFPWTFGPYQTQMHLLSVYLAEEHGLDVLWMCSVGGSALPLGEYKSFDDVIRRNPDIKVIPPPSDFGRLDHLTYVGSLVPGVWSLNGQNSVAASHINHLADHYNLDAVIMLRDAVEILPDVEFRVPVVGWIPIHSHGTIGPGLFEHWVLRQFHAFASLSPSSLRDAQQGLADDIRADTITMGYVPHIIDRPLLKDRARAARHRLVPAYGGDDDETYVCEVEGHCNGDKQRWERETIVRSFFRSKASGDETFIVHAKGGNYDKADRKGWDAAIQAFALLYQRVADSDLGGPPVHLYVHSVESQLIGSDVNHGVEAPPSVLPQGLNMRARIYHTNIPRSAYTLDGAIHDLDVVAGLQEMASVCLLPSRVEGFGMNILECQAVGTPVVTLNHTATGDYTKLGRSVDVRQYHYMVGVQYEFAQPDVPLLVDALWDLYVEHVTMLREKREGVTAGPVTTRRVEEVQDTMDWIDAGFSTSHVGQSMYRLLGHAESNLARRTAWSSSQAALGKSGTIPKTYEIVNGDHVEIEDRAPLVEWIILSPPGIRFDDKALRHFAWSFLYDLNAPALFFIPVPGVSDGDVANAAQKGLDIPMPLMIRTYFLTCLQGQTTQRRNLAHMALQQSNGVFAVKRMPDGVANLSE